MHASHALSIEGIRIRLVPQLDEESLVARVRRSIDVREQGGDGALDVLVRRPRLAPGGPHFFERVRVQLRVPPPALRCRRRVHHLLCGGVPRIDLGADGGLHSRGHLAAPLLVGLLARAAPGGEQGGSEHRSQCPHAESHGLSFPSQSRSRLRSHSRCQSDSTKRTSASRSPPASASNRSRESALSPP